LLSTHALHLIAVGVTLYAVFFHWAFQRDAQARRWLTAWSLVASLFLVARSVQIETHDPAVAIAAARALNALGALLAWTLLRFVLELSGSPPTRIARRSMLAVVVAICTASVATPWLVTDQIAVRRAAFGEPFLSAREGPLFPLPSAFGLFALAWDFIALARSRTLPAHERRVLIVTLASYAALGAASVASFLGRAAVPGLAEFGPLVVTIGTSRIVAARERDLARNLNALVDQQTAALRVSEERYRRLVDNAPVGVLACDADGNVLTITRRFREILELQPADAPTSPLNLFRDIPERAREHLAQLERAFRTGKVVSGELPYRTASGRTVELRIVIAPQPAPGGGVQGALVLIEDVTALHAVEARMRQSLKLEAIGQLAGGIAHGINAPLGGVRDQLTRMRTECAELAKLAEPGGAVSFAELEELIDESCEGVERALSIVRDMREISRGGSLVVEPLDLGDLLGSVVRMAAVQRFPGVELATHAGALPTVEGNRGQLQQVFLNLLVNALQAVGERGRVELDARVEGAGVAVRVHDDGPGIRPEDRERLFVPFFTTKAAGEGTGLGLFLSYQIVQRHRGEIRVESGPGAGSTFEVWLPLTRPPAGARA
jgi:PAS domain S-box-containing protein